MCTPLQLVFAMSLIFVIQSAPVKRQSQCSQRYIANHTLDNKALGCFYCAAVIIKSSILQLATVRNKPELLFVKESILTVCILLHLFQNEDVSILLKKNKNTEIQTEDDNCTNTLSYDIFTAAVSFKIQLQPYLFDNSGLFDCSGEAFQHLTNILVHLITVANIHRDIQVSNNNLKSYCNPSCFIINRIIPAVMYKTA